MAKPEWGQKRTCYSCAARFYDLRRDPIVCPVCNSVVDPERQPRPKRGGSVAREETALATRAGLVAEVAGNVVDEDVVDDEAEDVVDDAEEAGEDDELIEDTSELGEDDDDIGEVMEHVDDGLDDKP